MRRREYLTALGAGALFGRARTDQERVPSAAYGAGEYGAGVYGGSEEA